MRGSRARVLGLAVAAPLWEKPGSGAAEAA